eukprot:TRINITY_DN365_c0_g1_i5.p1 TRINITY_DN365_c0_g1~~TRINITY_DN365_c0_g1_i5.p1  ORF type:complete len:153 (+),score=60.79 TRINITY_DN365_c0_g1_i5:80-538(+)
MLRQFIKTSLKPRGNYYNFSKVTSIYEKQFTKDHEWIDIDGDIGTVGITDHAQSQLGDIVFIELPEVENEVVQNEVACSIESVKATSEIISPVDGVITEVNEQLEDSPELINSNAEDNGWIFKVNISNADQSTLLTHEQYKEFLETQNKDDE